MDSNFLPKVWQEESLPLEAVSYEQCEVCTGKSSGKGDRHPPRICSQRWLLKEMALVDNEIYIIIGRIAAEFFFPGEKKRFKGGARQF
ncbi:MAG: hypothetical protein ACOX4P_06915 [Anaerovoracaceae bacterium]|jgi:uracil-DNA glycosylase